MSIPAPRENPDLIGHDEACRTIEAAMAGGRLHHAWLITGPEGVGKASLAYRFARSLLAGTGPNTKNDLALPPSHPVFRRVAAGSHADLLSIEREFDEKKKKLKKNISVESVRQVPGFLHLTPAEGGWRVVIVDGAEDMHAASANALLKVLEEPPARAVLMLVSAMPGRLLPTIRSRCRHLPLRPLDAPAMAQVMNLYLPDLSAREQARLAILAEGSPGRALTLAQGGGLAIAALVDEVLEKLPNFPLLRGYQIADALREEDAFDMFFGLLRGAIAQAVTGGLRAGAAGRLLALRDPQAWEKTWTRLGELHAEAGQHNLDKRQAVVAGLALLG